MSVNQITQIRLADGKTISLTDWSSRRLFSTADILNGATDEQIRLFSYTEGDNVVSSDNLPAAARRIATLADTNIQTANQLASTEEFLVYAIEAEMYMRTFNSGDNSIAITIAGQPGLNYTTMKALHLQLLLELDISEKTFPISSIGRFAPGFGPVVTPAFSGNLSALALAESGIQSRDAVESLSIPLHIGGTEEYSVILHNPSGQQIDTYANTGLADTDETRVLTTRVSLCGLHKRPTA